MEEFSKLLSFIDLNVKDKIKEGTYIHLLSLIQNIYLMKQIDKTNSDDSDVEEESDIYGSY